MKSIGHALRAGWSRRATIANAAQLSTAIENKYGAELGVVLPATFTGSSLTFEVSADGSTFQPLYDKQHQAVSMSVSQGHSYALPAELLPWPHFKIKSGSSEGGARTLIVVIKG